MIYLDHAATSPLCDEARAAMEPYLTERFGNASEPHAAGRAAREGLQAARATIASLLDCAPRAGGVHLRAAARPTTRPCSASPAARWGGSS